MSELRALKILIADDEALARQRLRDLLDDCRQALSLTVVGEVEDGHEALNWVQTSAVDLLLTDIQMPDMSGIELALHLLKMKHPPRVIFVTAFSEHAVKAFELNAIDYLMKPVRIDRLLAALRKVPQLEPVAESQLDNLAAGARRFLSVTERHRIELVPIDDAIYFKADSKYVTIRTAAREYLLEESLLRLEQEFAADFMRIHRGYLVAKRAIKSLVRGNDTDDDENWRLELQGVSDLLPVSRRQRSVVQAYLKQK